VTLAASRRQMCYAAGLSLGVSSVSAGQSWFNARWNALTFESSRGPGAIRRPQLEREREKHMGVYDVVDGLEWEDVNPLYGCYVYMLFEEGRNRPFYVGHSAWNTHGRIQVALNKHGSRVHAIEVARCKSERHSMAVECAYVHIYESECENIILYKNKMPADFWTEGSDES
jgi:hypothetical protein